MKFILENEPKRIDMETIKALLSLISDEEVEVKIAEEWPKDYDLEFTNPHDDIDQSSYTNTDSSLK